jgi:hypothetical protein
MGVSKPTGLLITKSGNDLTLTWKLPTEYDSQQIYWSIGGSKAITALNGDDTTYTYTIPVANYFPVTKTKLPSVSIYVRGKKGSTFSSWASTTYKFLAPNKPVVEASDSFYFAWDVNTDYIAGKGDPDFVDVVYQRVNATSGTLSKVQWKNCNSSFDFTEVTGEAASGSVSFTETQYVEWFRAATRGLNGQSSWVSVCHIANAPLPAKGLTASISGTNVTVKWTPVTSVEHPIDYQYIQYSFATPTSETSKGVPICPSGATWTTAVNNIVKTAKKQTFSLGQGVPVDKCLFIRIGATFKNDTSQCDPVYAGSGVLVSPTLNSIVVDTVHKTTVVTLTDNSAVTLTKIAVINSQNKVLKTADHGTTTITINSVPTEKIQFGIMVYQGTSSSKPNMQSDKVFSTSGNIPLAPTDVTAVATERDGVAALSWTIPWTDADGAEISWADHDDAWMSTSTPQTFNIDQRVTEWNVAGLTSGVNYYFCVRLKDTANVYSPYSKMVSLSFASAPGKPTLTSSAVAVQPGEAFQLAWTYVTTDTTEQAQAVIYDNGVELARVENNAQRMSVTPAWLYNTSHSLTVQTMSASGYISEVSDPVVITVAAAPTISPIASSISSGIENGELVEMPIVMTVTGAGSGGQTTIKIERLMDFFVERPDGSVTEGYDGETIYAIAYGGDGQLTITPDDLVGSFDDGGKYRLTATVQDSVGQTASSFLDFTVNWTHQAEAPTATVAIDTTNLIARVTATAPESYEIGDVVDIYRLSVDKPELIVQGGTFGTTYIDPYPAAGGGYRFVDRTANGDYINEEGIAWVDVDGDLVLDEVVIDFDDNRLLLPYNLEISDSWKKDFEETKYLNGHIVGDWNAGVNRTVSITTDLPQDSELIPMIHELAIYSGVCHVRTPNGASYAADIQVSEKSGYSSSINAYTLNITRVDPEGFEGIDEDDY